MRGTISNVLTNQAEITAHLLGTNSTGIMGVYLNEAELAKSQRVTITSLREKTAEHGLMLMATSLTSLITVISTVLAF